MIRLAAIAALMLVAAPAFAADAAPFASPSSQPLKRGQTVRDANNIRLGSIDSVSADGMVGLILDGQYVRIPVSLVTNVDGKAQTSLTKKDLKKH